MPHFLTDLADLQVRTDEFLETVLDTAAQPIWVVDPDDVIRLANPAAVAALGYDDAEELLGRRSHETIHYRRPDGTPFPAADCPLALPRRTGETVARDLDWFIRRDGSMFPVSYVAAPIGMPAGRGAVIAFTDIEDRVRADEILREHDEQLRMREGSLRRIASLVAGGAASSEVFAAIAREVGRVIDLPMVALWRYEAEATATVIGEWSEHPHPFRAGTRWPLDGPTICAKVLETGRPVRIDDFSAVPGTIADAARGTRIAACAGAPIIVDGDIWGAMSADAIEPAPLPDGIEARLAEFTELVATAVASSASREQLATLADEQAALRRVATLVARQSPPAEIFAAVAEEVGRLLRVEDTTIFRYEDDGTATVVADRGDRAVPLPIGSRMSLEGDSATALVRRTGRAARIDDFSDATGPLADYTREAGIGSTVGSPIVVDGRLWGAMIAATRTDVAMPAGDRVAHGEVHRPCRDGDLERPGAVGPRGVPGTHRGSVGRGAPARGAGPARRSPAAPRPHGAHAAAGPRGIRRAGGAHAGAHDRGARARGVRDRRAPRAGARDPPRGAQPGRPARRASRRWPRGCPCRSSATCRWTGSRRPSRPRPTSSSPSR